MFRGPSFIVSTMQEVTTPIFKRLWYDWTQQQPGIEPTNPLGQCCVPPIVAFYDQQGLLRTYSLPGGSIRSPHPGSSRVSWSLFLCWISLTSGQLINQLFPDCTRSCFSKVVLCRWGGDRIYEMRCLFVAVGPNTRFIVLPHWDNIVIGPHANQTSNVLNVINEWEGGFHQKQAGEREVDLLLEKKPLCWKVHKVAIGELVCQSPIQTSARNHSNLKAKKKQLMKKREDI